MKKSLKHTLLFSIFLTLSAFAADSKMSEQIAPQHHEVQVAQIQHLSQPLNEEAGERILMIIALMLMSAEEEGHNQLHDMQREVPNMLAVVKDYRHCLQTASTQESAVACQQAGWTAAKAKKLDEESLDVPLGDELEHWAEKKTAYLDDLDRQLAQWDKVLPCVKNAKIPAHIVERLGFDN